MLILLFIIIIRYYFIFNYLPIFVSDISYFALKCLIIVCLDEDGTDRLAELRAAQAHKVERARKRYA